MLTPGGSLESELIMAQLLDFVKTHDIHTVLLDAAGTIYDNEGAYHDVPQVIASLQAQDVRVLIATNNTTRSLSGIRAHLLAFGVDIQESFIISSGLVLRDVPEFRRHVNSKRVYVVGSEESNDYVALAGGMVTTVLEDSEAIVLASSFPQSNQQWINDLCGFIKDCPKVPLLCINPDRYVQHEGGQYPVIGYYVDELLKKSDGTVLFGGKPEPSFSVCVQTVLANLSIPIDRGVLFCDDNPYNVRQLSHDLDIHGAYLQETGLKFEDFSSGDIHIWLRLV